ncbi:MAG: flavodoxin [Clostridia bacterium]|nr:flavodoxin [Clostridia bacterium]
MKTIVIYTSQTGFTKRYAEWIAERMNADILDIKDAKKKEAGFYDGYDAIVYGGWCMAGKVVKAEWFLAKAPGWTGKKLAIAAVGCSPDGTPEVAEALKQLLTDEQREYIKAFYCQGGINYGRMKFPYRMAMKMFANSLKNKKNATAKEKEMGEYIAQDHDLADIRYIEPIIAYLEA